MGEITVEPADNVPGPEGDELGLVVGELSRKMKADPRHARARAPGWWCDDIVSLSPGADALDPRRRDRGGQPAARRPTWPPTGRSWPALEPGELAWLFVYRPRPVSTFLAKVEVESRESA